MPAVPYQPRYTFEDYLQWEGDWELWDGQPVAMSPSPNWKHQGISGFLAAHMRGQLGKQDCGDCQVFFELDWKVSETTVVCPDVMIICDPPDEDMYCITRAPAFVVEIISPSRSANDRVGKRAIYESGGVKHYYIVDPADQTQNEFLVLGESGYAPLSALNDEFLFEPHPGCRVSVPTVVPHR